MRACIVLWKSKGVIRRKSTKSLSFHNMRSSPGTSDRGLRLPMQHFAASLVISSWSGNNTSGSIARPKIHCFTSPRLTGANSALLVSLSLAPEGTAISRNGDVVTTVGAEAAAGGGKAALGGLAGVADNFFGSSIAGASSRGCCLSSASTLATAQPIASKRLTFCATTGPDWTALTGATAVTPPLPCAGAGAGAKTDSTA
mmetsp:Transcript_104029/g.293380  ORF Transcript_104029/g.293380 Transcript_104029/m.293380 type:complete len:200 (+) Transcript_104029:592-1191(+)